MLVTVAIQTAVHQSAETTTSGGSEMLGLDIKYVYGLALLLLGAVLVFAQVWSTLHPAPVANEEAKQKVVEAANKVVDAAEQTERAAQSLVRSRQFLSGAGSSEELRVLQAMDSEARTLVAELAAEGDAVAQDAANAKAQAEEAKDEATAGSSLSDVANTVAGKLPLVGGAFIFVVLGAWISDFISITFN